MKKFLFENEKAWVFVDKLAAKIDKKFKRKYCWDKKEEFSAFYSRGTDLEILISNIFGYATLPRYKWNMNILEVCLEKEVSIPALGIGMEHTIFKDLEFTSNDLYKTIITKIIHKNSILPKRNKVTIEITDNKESNKVELTNKLLNHGNPYNFTPFTRSLDRVIYLIHKRMMLIEKLKKPVKKEKEKKESWTLYLK
jgi:hypothetical protein